MTIISFDKRTFTLETGRDKYILNVPLAYSPETISDATIAVSYTHLTLPTKA